MKFKPDAEMGQRGNFLKVLHRPFLLSPTVYPKGDQLINRLFSMLSLSGMILVMVGCVCAGRDHTPTDGENKPQLSRKQNEGTEKTQQKTGKAQKYIHGQVLVRLKPGVEPSVLDAIAEKLGLETIQPVALPGTYLMRIIGDEPVDSIIKKLEIYDSVEYGEPNYTIQPERKSK